MYVTVNFLPFVRELFQIMLIIFCNNWVYITNSESQSVNYIYKTAASLTLSEYFSKIL
jgi:hypothetical protein